jgi:hypothetical protein
MRPSFTRPPRQLRKARLDNIALVPASLLPFKEQWQQAANNLPDGAVLICMPPNDTPQRLILERVAAIMQSEGYHVTTVPTKQFR